MSDDSGGIEEVFLEVYRDMERKAVAKVKRSISYQYATLFQIGAALTLAATLPFGEWKGVGAAAVFGGLATVSKVLMIQEARRSAYED